MGEEHHAAVGDRAPGGAGTLDFPAASQAVIARDHDCALALVAVRRTSTDTQQPTRSGGVPRVGCIHICLICYFFCVGLYSVLTVNEWRPLRRRAASTWRPAFVAIRFMKPCSFLRFRRRGW